MAGNNSKVMSSVLLKKFNNTYTVTYDSENNNIVVGLTTCKRITVHDASKPFHINAKKFHRKVCFDTFIIELWKELQLEDSTKDITIFDVKNSVTIMKVTYQKITKQKVIELVRKGFNQIKKL